MPPSICIFCGSKPGTNPAYIDLARRTGRAIAARRITLIYGGGSKGMMGAVADSLLDAGGQAVGIIPDFLIGKEVAHPRITDMRIVKSMLDRKAMMISLADAFLTLPGGYGTLDELFEVVTWNQIGTINKPCGLLNINNFFTPTIQQIDLMVKEGYIYEKNRSLILDDDNLDRLLDRLIKRMSA
jgi:hypothetical protein